MATQQQGRTLVLDTSILVHDPNCIEGFPYDTIIISSWVVDELDHLKRSEGERGEHARRASRNIHEYSVSEQFSQGMRTKSGGMLRAETISELPSGVESSADNKTIFLAKRLKSASLNETVIVISKDTNLRTKASMFGVASGDYEGEGSIHDPYAIFPGCLEIIMNSREPMDEINRKLMIDVNTVGRVSRFDIDALIPNQCVYLRFEDKEALAVYKHATKRFRLVPKPKTNGKGNPISKSITPKNCEQALAYSLLMDPEIKLVALIGTAGPGKTLMSLLGAYHQLRSEFWRNTEGPETNKAIYDQIIVFRPNIEMGQPLGFLPGTIDEKFEPWMYPIFDNLHLILQGQDVQAKTDKRHNPVLDLIDSGMLEINPINYIRGRSFHHKIIIADEAQNLTHHEIKSLVTRAGAGSKIILTGDISQIDHPYLSQISNGLSHVVSRFLGQEIFGLTVMKRGEERSLLAKLGAELL